MLVCLVYCLCVFASVCVFFVVVCVRCGCCTCVVWMMIDCSRFGVCLVWFVLFVGVICMCVVVVVLCVLYVCCVFVCVFVIL